jgi:MGT family glycosyltransferase
VATIGRQNDPTELGPYPSNVVVRSYIPQNEVLPWCDAAVIHGGAGTTLGVLAHGVPMLVIPQGADQWSNAERVVAVGAGRQLLRHELAVESIRAEVAMLLDDASYRAAAATLRQEIRDMPGAAEAITGIEALL